MKADTRLFGEIDIQDDKIIKLKEGIIGFPDLQNFTLIYDEEKEGVKFEDLPEDWTCPLCGVGKDMFEKVEE